MIFLDFIILVFPKKLMKITLFISRNSLNIFLSLSRCSQIFNVFLVARNILDPVSHLQSKPTYLPLHLDTGRHKYLYLHRSLQSYLLHISIDLELCCNRKHLTKQAAECKFKQSFPSSLISSDYFFIENICREINKNFCFRYVFCRVLYVNQKSSLWRIFLNLFFSFGIFKYTQIIFA